uniref:RNA polymerase beta' subunit n=1 Tax=Asplenium castaneoviride TaxID=2601855 RepID=UPI0023AA4092|nr:RNA polymerase beta' subunit [Asplenium castaneoviride]YP_010702238.1 RNA polymerase beta' subunit [Asplenium ruprechtii]WCL38418.1 RNA polymerase beta' subunit [Asplenium castaneoviride]WCL38506.1 RNA polymerase beta' subunit [Asplenium castaneoviride]WCL38594.1 RNA polymerase beta' subunit [Asplenium ruprechtii]
MIHRANYQQLRIGLASPEQIRGWAERELPNGDIVGQVNQPYTLHHKTHKPERDGSFCERIFGPIKSGVCACGNYRSVDNEEEYSNFCKHCGVEFTDSRVRRYQMGYIKLACPVTHVWFSKRIPSYIANPLAKPLKELESPVYCDLFLARPVAKRPNLLRLRGLFNYEDRSWKNILPVFFSTRNYEMLQRNEIATGGDAVKKGLTSLDLRSVMDRAYLEWQAPAKQRPVGNDWEDRTIRRRKDLSVRRMKLARDFLRTNLKPEWMVLDLSPVLPPELRPIVESYEGELVTSDLNELYRKVIYRNNTLAEFLSGSEFTPEGLIICQRRLIQEAVDALIDNGIRGQPMRDINNRPYKSFSEVIEGKEGRFRENLLGKRVDYSGRFVIVVGPSLSLHQCGLPREMSIEPFQVFVIRNLIGLNLASNLRAAKNLIRKEDPVIWEVLREVMRGHPILLNRAPTLHRLGIQAFQPILIEGRAIRLHPLVRGGFNADLDGDQMAVHVPLSLEAQIEARLSMFSHINLLSPATGDSVSVPSQDMLLGLYVLTIENKQGIYGNRHPVFVQGGSDVCLAEIPCFLSYYDILRAKESHQIDFCSFLWLRWEIDSEMISSKSRELPIESQYESLGTSLHLYDNYQIRKCRKGFISSIYALTTAGRILFNQQMKEAMLGVSKASSCAILSTVTQQKIPICNRKNEE